MGGFEFLQVVGQGFGGLGIADLLAEKLAVQFVLQFGQGLLLLLLMKVVFAFVQLGQTIHLPALVLDLETGGFEFAPAHFEHGLGKGQEGAELGEGFVVQIILGRAQDERQTEGDDAGEVVGEGAAAGGGLDVVLVGGQFIGIGKEVLGGEPFLVAAVAPFGDVLGCDGASVELAGEDGLDLGEPVEPLQDGFGFEAIFETGVELSADLAGEAGDFTDTCHKTVISYIP